VWQTFARKLFDLCLPKIAETADNEKRTIKKLRGAGEHPNIIQVLGWGNFKFLDRKYAFIDMELCDVNLEQYIREQHNRSDLITVMVHDFEPGLKELQVWDIMKQIATALAYIHKNKQVHRDLKPRNG